MKRFLLLLSLLAVPAAAQDKSAYLWRFKPDVNSRWTGQYAHNIRMVENIPGFDKVTQLDLTMTQRANFEWDVIRKDSAGNVRVRLTYNEMTSTLDTQADGQPILPEQNQQMNAQTTNLMALLQGASLTFTVAPTGQISQIDGAKEIEAVIKNEINRQARAGANPFAAQFRTFYSKEGLESLMGTGGKLPSSPLKPGNSYAFPMNYADSENFGMNSTSKRTLTKRGGGYAFFTESGTAKILGSKVSETGLTEKVTMAANCNIQTSFAVHEPTGVVTKISGRMTTQGKILLKVRGRNGGPTIPSASTSAFVVAMQRQPSPTPEGGSGPGVVILN